MPCKLVLVVGGVLSPSPHGPLSTGLFECLHDMGAGFLQSE